MEDVRREIQITTEHPNVVMIKGVYEDVVAVHLVMELCAGRELFDRITSRIVWVVEACHYLGVMHRDLKPKNFLFMNKRVWFFKLLILDCRFSLSHIYFIQELI